MNEEKTYLPEEDEEAVQFMRRVTSDQPDREPLRIVEQLVEIAIGLLKGRPCQLKATASRKSLTVTLRHSGKPIDERMIWLMNDHTDHVEYHPEGNDWVLTILRDVPPIYIARR